MEKFQGKYRISSARLKSWDYASEGIYFITICTKNREHYLGEIVRSIRKQNEMKLSVLGMAVEMEWLRTPEIRPDMNLSLGEYQVMPNHFHAILIIGENQFNTNKTIDDPRTNPADPRRDAMLASLNNSDSKSDTDAMFASLNNTNSKSYPDAMFASLNNTNSKSYPDAMLASLNNSDSKSDPDAMLASLNDPDFNQISELEYQMIIQSNTKGINKFAPQSKNLGSVMRGFKSSVSSFAKDNNVIFNWQPRYYDHVIRNHNEFMRISMYIRNNPANWKNDRLR